MVVDMSIIWQECPGQGQITIKNGQFIGGCIAIGNGSISDSKFSFSGHGPCHMPFAVKVDDETDASTQPLVFVTDEHGELEVSVDKVLEQGEMILQEQVVTVYDSCFRYSW
jgi:hypothetical protein